MLRFLNKGKPDLPAWWDRYEEMFEHQIRADTSLDAIHFAVIDIESTGTDPSRDSMISFAGVHINQFKIHVGQSIELILNQSLDHSDGAIHIHEIIRQEKKEGIMLEEALPEILNFLGNSVLVGFNINFDLKFIDHALKKVTGKKLLNASLEINQLIGRIEDPVHRILPARQRDLNQLCRAFGIEATDVHTAAGDAFSSAQLFLTMLNKLRKRGIIRWRDLKKNSTLL